MALILRVDVDKPYGHSNLIRKVASKVSEDYFKIPLFSGISYLSHFIRFLEYCNANGVPGFMYHRMCTIPDQHVNELLKAGGHQLGFHAENTRTSATFAAELKRFRQQTSLPVNSFTKHGSGTLKLGKHHYPPYEPGKYKVWAQQEGIGYYFGNGICTSAADLFAVNGFFENMFWVERDYRNASFSELKQVVDAARIQDVAILIHPENFDTFKTVADDFKHLVQIAREQGVSWKVC